MSVVVAVVADLGLEGFEIRGAQKASKETSASDRGECCATQIGRRRSSSAVSPTACDPSDTFGRRTEAALGWRRQIVI